MIAQGRMKVERMIPTATPIQGRIAIPVPAPVVVAAAATAATVEVIWV
jgi:hypothetical protein